MEFISFWGDEFKSAVTFVAVISVAAAVVKNLYGGDAVVVQGNSLDSCFGKLDEVAVGRRKLYVFDTVNHHHLHRLCAHIRCYAGICESVCALINHFGDGFAIHVFDFYCVVRV